MRVVVNELQALKQRTGIGRYTLELLRALRELAPDEVTGFPSGWLRALARRSLAADRRWRPTSGPVRPGPVARWRGWATARLRQGADALLEARLRRSVAERPGTLYHEPNYLPLAVDCPTLITVHDLSTVRHPEWHPAERAARFARQLPGALASAAHVLTVSAAIRSELIHDFGVPAERVTHAHLGVHPGLRPLPADEVAEALRHLGLPSRYLLAVGTLEPRKNLLRLLRAYVRLPAPQRDRWPLVLVGGWGWQVDELAAFLNDEARHRGVLHLGFVDDARLPALYNGAGALFFPSWYEGFGLPLVEMMACGGAVIASSAEALREVAGGHAHFIDPADDDGWFAALDRATREPDWLATLRQGVVAWAGRFTWARCADATLSIYRQVHERHDSKTIDHRRAG